MSSNETTVCSHALVSVVLVLTAACETGSSVGKNLCPSEWSCASHSLTSQLVEVDTLVPEQAPAFTRAFGSDVVASYTPGQRFGVLLAPGADQSVLVVAPEQRVLSVHRFDSDGAPLGALGLTPPAGYEHDDPNTQVYLLVDFVPSDSGPLLNVEWVRPFVKGAANIYREWILLSPDGTEAATRLAVPEQLNERDGPELAVARTADGQGILVIDRESCWRFDNRGEVVWRRTSRPHGMQEFTPYGGMLTSLNAQLPSTSLGQGAEAFSTPVYAWADRSGEDVVWQVAFGSLTLTPEGDIALEQYDVDALTSDADNLRAGHMSLARDEGGRLWTFTEPGNGDVYALNAQSTSNGYRFLRQEYQELALGPTRSAPDGSMFMVAIGGGRAASDHSNKLCRVLPAGARCFGVGEFPDSILPLSASQVLVVNGGGLTRYDLPTD